MAFVAVPTFLYRVFRLRRLLGLLAGLHCLGLGLALLTTPAALHPAMGAITLISCGVTGYLALRLPHGWMETVLLAAVAAAALAIGGALAASALPGSVFDILTLIVFAFLGWLGLVCLVSRYAPGIGLRQRCSTYTAVLPVSARALRRQMFLRPAACTAHWATGPINDQGLFAVSAVMQGHCNDDLPVQSFAQPPRPCCAGVLQSGTDFQITLLCARGSDGSIATAAVQERAADSGQGCEYRRKEVHGLHDSATAFGHWLLDMQGDYLTAHVDALLGRPERAIQLQAIETPLTVLAGWLTPPGAAGKGSKGP